MGCSPTKTTVKVHPQVTTNSRKELCDSATQTDQIKLADASINTEQISAPAAQKKNENVIQILKNQQKPFSNPRLKPVLIDEDIEWILISFDAQQFNLGIQKEFLSIPPTIIQLAVQAMRKEPALSNLRKEVWDLLETAGEKDDATYFIYAYTMESDFYRILNRTLAQYQWRTSSNDDEVDQFLEVMNGALENLNTAFQSFQAFQAGQQFMLESNETNWARLYLKPLYRLLCVPNAKLRYQGRTYRGVWLSENDLEPYLNKPTQMCHKAVTSTSKSRTVAEGFIKSQPEAMTNMYQTLFTYVIEADCSLYALNIRDFSDLPEEEEVLLLPGILFSVADIKYVPSGPIEIELRSSFKAIMETFGSSCGVQ